MKVNLFCVQPIKGLIEEKISISTSYLPNWLSKISNIDIFFKNTDIFRKIFYSKNQIEFNEFEINTLDILYLKNNLKIKLVDNYYFNDTVLNNSFLFLEFEYEINESVYLENLTFVKIRNFVNAFIKKYVSKYFNDITITENTFNLTNFVNFTDQNIINWLTFEKNNTHQLEKNYNENIILENLYYSFQSKFHTITSSKDINPKLYFIQFFVQYLWFIELFFEYEILEDRDLLKNKIKLIEKIEQDIYSFKTIIENFNDSIYNKIEEKWNLERNLVKIYMYKHDCIYTLTTQNINSSSKKTKLINLIGGPGIGKTTFAAKLFFEMKMLNKSVEYVQEYAKKLVWMNKIEDLNNQYMLTKKQIELFDSLIDKVDYIITDGSILHGLYYNRYNLDNVSNVGKTEKLIIDKYFEYDNLNIFLNRKKNMNYENEGRIQNEKEALEVDYELKNILKEKNISFYNIDLNNDIETNTLEMLKIIGF